MQEMIDSVKAIVELASRQGSAQARIALHPEELGGIRIHLSQSAEGLLARIVPETAAAARALAEGHFELHRSLSALGLPLRMDVSAYGHPDARQREDRSANQPGGSRAPSTSANEEFEQPECPQGLDRAQPVSEPVGGTLVNVLA